MTRISGEYLVLATCCGKVLTTPSYSSVNLTANEHWTDGKVVGGLFNNGGGLRLCECGEVFLLSDAKKVGNIPKEKPLAPADWNRKSGSWWHRLWGFPTREQIIKDYDTRSLEEIEAAEQNKPPAAKYIRDDQLQKLLEKKNKPAIELRLRRMYWRYLNDNYRAAIRTLPPTEQPVFSPAATQTENMHILASLIESGDDMDVLELVELYRELGDFDKAQKLLPLLTVDYEVEIKLQTRLIVERCQAPTPLRQHPK
jgi:hypothetical protein